MIGLSAKARTLAAGSNHPLPALSLLLMTAFTLHSAPLVSQQSAEKRVILSDAGGNLVLELSYDGKCLLDHVRVHGREVVRRETGVCSAIKLDGQWFTTRGRIATPEVKVT